jgi:hypothetical protein
MVSLLVVSLALLSGAPVALGADAPETDPQIVAAAVRARGFPCDRPQSVERDSEASLPDRKAWTLRCETARYRVIFEGDTGPQVTRIK